MEQVSAEVAHEAEADEEEEEEEEEDADPTANTTAAPAAAMGMVAVTHPNKRPMDKTFDFGAKTAPAVDREKEEVETSRMLNGFF